MVPIVTRLAEDFAGRAVVAIVDTSVQRQLTRDYGITVVPTFIFFKSGREVSRQLGSTSYQNLAGQLEALLP